MASFRVTLTSKGIRLKRRCSVLRPATVRAGRSLAVSLIVGKELDLQFANSNAIAVIQLITAITNSLIIDQRALFALQRGQEIARIPVGYDCQIGVRPADAGESLVEADGSAQVAAVLNLQPAHCRQMRRLRLV